MKRSADCLRYVNYVEISITLRDEPLPSNVTVLLQFGNGGRKSAGQLADQATKRHDYWQGVLDDCGRFAISVYALIDIPEERIAKVMHHTMYGRATVGDVKDAGFAIQGSTISFEGMLASTRDIQRFHQTIFLGTAGVSEHLLENKIRRLELEALVRPEIDGLLELFEPRSRNPFR